MSPDMTTPSAPTSAASTTVKSALLTLSDFFATLGVADVTVVSAADPTRRLELVGEVTHGALSAATDIPDDPTEQPSPLDITLTITLRSAR